MPACDAASIGSLSASIARAQSSPPGSLFAVATPMHMMAPISAGTTKVVCVMNSIQTIPANAAGKAEMIMKGSSQDWKLTTISR